MVMHLKLCFLNNPSNKIVLHLSYLHVKFITYIVIINNCISVLISSVVVRGFEPHSGQTKEYKIGICCFSAKHAALRGKSKDWLARNQDNV